MLYRHLLSELDEHFFKKYFNHECYERNDLTVRSVPILGNEGDVSGDNRISGVSDELEAGLLVWRILQDQSLSLKS